MSQENVELMIPFESLVGCIEKLNIEDKIRLLELLEEQLAQAEEEMLEHNPIIQSEINKARKAYKAKDYISVDDYIKNRAKRNEL
ncbi:MAG: hypothetical protein AAB116_19560 [Candidatus Poribacteria bacterium]